jgi:hypothetical protein
MVAFSPVQLPENVPSAILPFSTDEDLPTARLPSALLLRYTPTLFSDNALLPNDTPILMRGEAMSVNVML